MKNQLSIQIRTSLLLFVFLLNTMVVFACSLGMDMKLDSDHHQEKTTVSASHHHEGDLEHRENIASNAPNHRHEMRVNHHENDRDDCCKDEAVEFAKVDKLPSQTSNAEINPIFFPALLTCSFNINVLADGPSILINKFVVLGYHPPIPDIRVVIQSFQI